MLLITIHSGAAISWTDTIPSRVYGTSLRPTGSVAHSTMPKDPESIGLLIFMPRPLGGGIKR